MGFLLRRAMMAGGVPPGYDPYFEQVVSLSDFEGADGAVTFSDQSGSGGGGLFTSASAAALSTARSKYGASSSRFANINAVFTSANNLTFTTGVDFTAEAWVYLDAVGTTQVIWRHGSFSSTGYEFYADSTGALLCYGNSSTILATGASVIPAATWTHCAVTRSGGVWKIWVGGVLQATSGVNNLVLSGRIYFGLGGYSVIGNIDSWRYTSGVARYTTNFTPSTVAFPNSSNQTYATWSPSDKGASITLSGGNLTATQTATNSLVRATLGKSTGKWYWEVTLNTAANEIGIANASASLTQYCGQNTNSWGYYSADGRIYTNNAGGAANAISTTGDVIGCALDMDAGTFTIYRNGAVQANGVSGLTGTIYPAWGNVSADSCTANFGATPFKYTVPAGYNPGLF